MSRKTKNYGRAGKDRSKSKKGKSSKQARSRRERKRVRELAKAQHSLGQESRGIVADEKTARKIRAELKRQAKGAVAIVMSDTLIEPNYSLGTQKPARPYLALSKGERRERILQILDRGYENAKKSEAITLTGGFSVKSER